MKKNSSWIFSTTLILLCTTFFLITGCSKKPTKYNFNPYVSKSYKSPEVKYCFDTVGHKRGSYPFILGGTCCCTPTKELMKIYHEDGFLLDWDLAKLKAEYEKKGIVLRYDHRHDCNNYCENGPHVVFGGKCMAPPVAGTQNCENVATGKKPEL